MGFWAGVRMQDRKHGMGLMVLGFLVFCGTAFVLAS